MKSCIISLLLALVCCSCAPTTQDIYGKSCTALTDRQIKRLIIKSRLAMKNNVKKGVVSASEAAFAERNEPNVDIRYRGDCYGTAFITWRTRTRVVGLRFDNELDADIPSCSLTTSTVPDAVSILPNKSIKGR